MVSLSLNTLVILIIVIAVLVAVLGVYFGYFKISPIHRSVVKNRFCNQLVSVYVCGTKYLDEATYSNKSSEIKCSEIGKKSCKGGEYATLAEVCEYLGFTNWDDCLEACGCIKAD